VRIYRPCMSQRGMGSCYELSLNDKDDLIFPRYSSVVIKMGSKII